MSFGFNIFDDIKYEFKLYNMYRISPVLRFFILENIKGFFSLNNIKFYYVI